MKKSFVIIPAALMLAAPAFAGDGGQTVASATKTFEPNFGQVLKDFKAANPDYKLGQEVKSLNGDQGGGND